jgi:hypothetical protein
MMLSGLCFICGSKPKANELYGRDSAGLLAVADDNQLGDIVIFSH